MLAVLAVSDNNGFEKRYGLKFSETDTSENLGTSGVYPEFKLNNNIVILKTICLIIFHS
jgi:hypothetical protein